LARGFEVAALWAGSVGDVWGVGLQPGGACQYQTMTVHWDGSAWTVVPSPGKLDVNSVLAAVSGTGTTDVWAVGATGCPGRRSGTLALHWNGSSWSIVPTPAPGFVPYLHGVAALTPSDAWAVGDTTMAGTDDPLIEHWNGRVWQVSQVGPAVHGSLLGVAASGAANVWAVGSPAVQGRPGLVALHWNGRNWSPVPVPVPRGATGQLFAVAPLPNGQAVAAGQWRVGSAAHVLIETWDGTAWHMAGLPTVSGFSGLYSVATASGQGPWASGFAVSPASGSGVLFERVAGTWQLVSPPPLSSLFSVAGASDGQVWTADLRFIAHGAPLAPGTSAAAAGTGRDNGWHAAS
jgi:hypothetical protein